MTTHYDILGVEKDASDADIKKAYRQLSLKYHPDRNKSDEASSKMQKINEAYNILGNSAEREKYNNELNGGGGGMHPFDNFDGFGDINNIFNMMFHGGGGGGFPGGGFPGGGFPGFPGGGGGIRIFHNGVQVNPSMFMRPEPIMKKVTIPLEQSYLGCNVQLNIERNIVRGGSQSKENDVIYVSISPGVDDNEIITIAEKGHIVNDIKGEIKIIVEVKNDTDFQRNGMDLLYHKKISLKESLCGLVFEINHLNGKKLSINNKSNSTIIKPNYRKIVPSLGMIRENHHGNLIIEFDVEFPDSLTPEQVEELSKIL